MHHDFRLSSVKLPLTTRDTSAYFFMKIRSTALTITLSCTRCIIHNTAKGWTDAGTQVKSTLSFRRRNNMRARNQTWFFQNTRTHTYTLLWTICKLDESDCLTIWGNVAFSFHPNEWLQVLEAVSLSVCVVARLWDETRECCLNESWPHKLQMNRCLLGGWYFHMLFSPLLGHLNVIT